MFRLWSSFLKSWEEHFGMQLATLSVLTGTFIVLSVFFFLHGNSLRLLAEWGKDVQLMVYLEPDISESQIGEVKKFLTELEAFKEVRFIDKTQAAKEFQMRLGSMAPDVLADPEFGNPLPSSFELKLEGGANKAGHFDRLKQLTEQIGQLFGVEDVSFGQGWVENYATVVKMFELSSAFLIAVLLAGSLFVVGNSIRQTIHQRREEIEILELVGATSAHIRGPFVFEGLVMGSIAAAGSLLFLYGLFYLLKTWIVPEIGFWGVVGGVKFINYYQALLLIVLGASFGAMGAYFCVRKVATGWAAIDK